jgi:4-amino-4-deoxy-L-arabinose transferase-like glycosyltransferase
MKSRRVWFLGGLVALCLAGVALELYATRSGPAIRGDSVRYVMGARNILAGNGFSRLSGGGEVFPETGFAPLLSFALTALGLAGIDMYAGARVMNALLFGGSLFLVGTLISLATHSRWLGLLGVILVLLAPNVFEWHAWVMSEALFIFLLLLSVYGLVMHIESGGPGFLALAALAAGAASLARYVGVSLVPAGAAAILLWGHGRWKDRAGRAAIFALLACLPFALWMVRNVTVGGAGLANRQVRYHPFRPEMLRVLLFEPTTWVIPEFAVLPRTVRGALSLLLLLGGPILFLLQVRRWRTRGSAGIREEQAVLPLTLLLLIPAYLAVLAFNSLFLDAATTYTGVLRYLTPLFVLVVLLEVTTYARGFPAGRQRRPVAALLTVLLVLLLSTNAQATMALARISAAQLGFPPVEGEWADLAARLKGQGPDEPILTDNPEMIYYLTGRPAYTMPIKYDPYQQAFRQDFAEQIELARERLEGGAVLVVFGAPSEEEAEVIGRLGVEPLHSYEGSAVYGYAD